MPTRLHFQHHTWLKRLHLKRLKGLWGVYLHSLFRIMGMSLTGIFIPIYIYKLTSSFTHVFLFFLLYHLTVVSASCLTGLGIKKFGMDKASLLGALLRTVFLLFLIFSQDNLVLLWPTALFWGLAVSSTWLPYHYTVVVEDDGDGTYGHEVALLKIVEKAASGAAPFIGGLLVYFFGFTVLYAVGIVFVVFSALPMLVDRVDKKNMRYDLGSVWKGIFKRKFRPLVVGFTGYILENQVFCVLRPLFIFIALASAAQLGAIESVAILSTILVVWWVGRWVDRKGFGLLKIGAVVNALVLLLLPFLSSSWEFFLHSTIYVLTASLIWTPFDAAMYQLASKRQKLEFFVQREIIIHSAAVLFYLFLILAFGENLNWLLVFAVGSLGLLLSSAILKGVKGAKIDQGLEIHPPTAR